MVLLVAGLIALTVVWLEPVRALAINWNELSIGFGELLLRLLPALALVFVATALTAFALVAAIGERGVAVLVALYVGLWLQTSVLVGDYGPFDGRAVVWDDFSRLRGLEIAVWAGVVGCAVWQAARVRHYAGAIAAGVLALYLASLGEQVAGAAPFSERVPPAASSAALSRYSTQRNALIIVLDTLQSDFFAELLLDPQFAARVPPGFTYYRNATSYYGSTQFSLQSILTSARVADHVDAAEFVHDQMKRSVPSRLGALGFDAALATFATGNMPGCRPSLGPYRCVRLEQVLARDPAIAS
ncbi:MAG: hypothetical protein ABGW95_03855, partial [Candidatus Poseidoniia archaeon]